MDFDARWKGIIKRLKGATPPKFEEKTVEILSRPIQVPHRAGVVVYVYVEAIEHVHTPLEEQFFFRFRVHPEMDEIAHKPEWGASATAYGDSFKAKSAGDTAWTAKRERVFWYTFSSRKSLKENLSDLQEYVREEYDRGIMAQGLRELISRAMIDPEFMADLQRSPDTVLAKFQLNADENMAVRHALRHLAQMPPHKQARDFQSALIRRVAT